MSTCPKIIHSDLAARNVLVGEDEVCKITDFGRTGQEEDIYVRIHEVQFFLFSFLSKEKKIFRTEADLPDFLPSFNFYAGE